MIADDPGRPDGRVLLDGGGREIARFQETVREDRRVADLFTLAVAPDEALPIVLAELAGCSGLAVGEGGPVLGAVLINANPR